jgi:hypothetical protein
LENNSQQAERFIWSGGRPIFDLLKGLITGDRSAPDDSIEFEFRAKFDNSRIKNLIDERGRHQHHNKMLEEKILSWKKEIKELRDIGSLNSQKLLKAILWDDPRRIDTEKKLSDVSIADIQSWINTANSAITENNKTTDNLNKKIAIEFSQIQSEIAADLQIEVNKHSEEILKLNSDFITAMTGIASEYGFQLRGNIDNLKIFGISPFMLAHR